MKFSPEICINVNKSNRLAQSYAKNLELKFRLVLHVKSTNYETMVAFYNAQKEKPCGYSRE